MYMYIQRGNMTYEAKDNKTIKYFLGHVMMDHPAQVRDCGYDKVGNTCYYGSLGSRTSMWLYCDIRTEDWRAGAHVLY